MILFLEIVLAGLLILVVVRLWPVYKQWQENGPKAESGDWQAAIIPLLMVVGLVVLLVAMVQ